MAISNHGLLAFDGDQVTFAYKDYAHGGQRRTMTLRATEFPAASSSTMLLRISCQIKSKRSSKAFAD